MVGGEVADPNVFNSCPSTTSCSPARRAVGRVVMRTAAENLTPVTLELGGKSPAIVSAQLPRRRCGQAHRPRQVDQRRADLRVARLRAGAARARRRLRRRRVAQRSGASTRRFRATPTTPASSTTAMRPRMRELLDDARAQGRARVIACGSDAGAGRQMPLHVVTQPDARHAADAARNSSARSCRSWPTTRLDDAIGFISAGSGRWRCMLQPERRRPGAPAAHAPMPAA